MLTAITRPVSPAIVGCELTHLSRSPIDVNTAAAQHAAYERALEELGCRIVRLALAPDLPDSVFVEDAAVVLDEVAVMTRPGAASRRAEVPAVAEALAALRPLRAIEAPGTLDGGDVLRAGRRLFVGRSSRTNDEGIRQLRSIAAAFDYDVVAVAPEGCLHLKSAVTEVRPGLLLLNPEWVAASMFPGLECVEVDPAEPSAANVLPVGNGWIYPSAFPVTLARLERQGIRPTLVDVSELATAEGAVTCCSVIVPVPH